MTVLDDLIRRALADGERCEPAPEPIGDRVLRVMREFVERTTSGMRQGIRVARLDFDVGGRPYVLAYGGDERDVVVLLRAAPKELLAEVSVRTWSVATTRRSALELAAVCDYLERPIRGAASSDR